MPRRGATTFFSPIQIALKNKNVHVSYFISFGQCEVNPNKYFQFIIFLCNPTRRLVNIFVATTSSSLRCNCKHFVLTLKQT